MSPGIGRERAALLVLGAALALPGTVPAQSRDVRAVAEVVAEPVEVGTVFELEVRVESAPGAEAAPVLEETLGPFRVFDAARSAEVDTAADDPGVQRFRIRLGAFVLPGDHEIPPVPVGIRASDGELALIETPPTPLRVISSLPAEAEAGDIHDIRGPFDVRIPPQWGRIALAALVLAALAGGIWFWLRRRTAASVPAPPPLPPAVEAEAALARLRSAGLLEAGEVAAFYEQLAGIMKRYAGRRFASRWSERTTGEILDDLAPRFGDDGAAPLPLLARVLNEADLAKFSDRPCRPDAAQARFADAGAFLARTRPAPDPASSSAGGGAG